MGKKLQEQSNLGQRPVVQLAKQFALRRQLHHQHQVLLRGVHLRRQGCSDNAAVTMLQLHWQVSLAVSLRHRQVRAVRMPPCCWATVDLYRGALASVYNVACRPLVHCCQALAHIAAFTTALQRQQAPASTGSTSQAPTSIKRMMFSWSSSLWFKISLSTSSVICSAHRVKLHAVPRTQTANICWARIQDRRLAPGSEE